MVRFEVKRSGITVIKLGVDRGCSDRTGL